jgi:hypothetical protein
VAKEERMMLLFEEDEDETECFAVVVKFNLFFINIIIGFVVVSEEKQLQEEPHFDWNFFEVVEKILLVDENNLDVVVVDEKLFGICN